MKFAIVSVFVLALSIGTAVQYHSRPSTFGIKEDIEDFLALIPRDKVLNIIVNYLAVDKEVQETLQYILSNEFKHVVLDLEAIPEYREFLKYLQSNGLNVYYYLDRLHEFLGMSHFVPRYSLRSLRGEPGVRGMLDAIEAILPVQQLKAMFDDKIANSPAFANLMVQMRSEDFKEIVAVMRADKDFQELIQEAISHGIDIEKIHEILNKIFGW